MLKAKLATAAGQPPHGARCQHCAFGIPAQGNPPKLQPGLVIECRRMPLPVLKLKTDFCGEFEWPY